MFKTKRFLALATAALCLVAFAPVQSSADGHPSGQDGESPAVLIQAENPASGVPGAAGVSGGEAGGAPAGETSGETSGATTGETPAAPGPNGQNGASGEAAPETETPSAPETTPGAPGAGQTTPEAETKTGAEAGAGGTAPETEAETGPAPEGEAPASAAALAQTGAAAAANNRQRAAYTYTVYYHGNGATEASKGDPYVEYSMSPIVITSVGATGFSRYGYYPSFQRHWNTEPDGTGDGYVSGDILATPGENHLYAQWDYDGVSFSNITYRNNFPGTNGSGGSADIDLLPGTAVNTPGLPGNGASSHQKYGHTFTGWNTEANGSGDHIAPGGQFTPTLANHTLYAQWEWDGATYLEVTYSQQPGIFSKSVTEQYVPYSEITIPAPQDLGLALGENGQGGTFDGWASNPVDIHVPEYSPGAPLQLYNNDLTLYTHWSSTGMVGITFDPNGGKGDYLEMVFLATRYLIPSASNFSSVDFGRAGHTLTGFNTEPDGSGTDVGFGERIRFYQDTTLYAQWLHDAATWYNVSYTGTDGNIFGPVQTVPGTIDVLPYEDIGLDPLPEGTRLERWNYLATNGGTGTVAPGPNAHYLDSDVLFYTSEENLSYRVTLTHTAGGTVDTAQTGWYGRGAQITLPTPTPHAGYTFTDWRHTGGGQLEQVTPGDTWRFTVGQAPATLTAQFEPIEYTITYNGLQSGDGNPNRASYTVEDVEIMLSDAARPGYDFVGWYDNAECTGTPTATIPAGSTGNITLWAKFTQITHTVTYQAPTGETDAYTLPEGPIDLLAYEDTALPALGTGTRFEHWSYRNASGQLATLAPGQNAYTLLGSTTFTAVLTHQITITGTPGGAVDTSLTGWYNEGLLTLPTPTPHTGYTFTGWRHTGGGTLEETAPGTWRFTVGQAPATLTAQFEPIRYTITYHGLQGGDTNPGPTSYTVEDGEITLQDATRPDYTFLGWYDNAACTGTPLTTLPAGGTGDIALWAKFARTTAEMPRLTDSSPDQTTAEIGEEITLFVTAEAPDGGTLGYQWYEVLFDDPADWSTQRLVPIPGATAESYAPPTATAGTRHYLAEITNTHPDALHPFTVQSILFTLSITEKDPGPSSPGPDTTTTGPSSPGTESPGPTTKPDTTSKPDTTRPTTTGPDETTTRPGTASSGNNGDTLAVTGLPQTIRVGDTFTLYPEESDTRSGADGWQWDEEYFTATFNSPATFTALKAGETTIIFTSTSGRSFSLSLTIQPGANATGSSGSNKDDSAITKTGDAMALWPFVLLGIAALGAITALVLVKRKKGKK